MRCHHTLCLELGSLGHYDAVVVHQQAVLDGEIVSLFPIRSDEGLLGHVQGQLCLT